MGRPFKRTKEVQKHFKNNKCYLVKHGREHDFWENPQTGGHTRLNRGSKGIGKGLYFKMCNDLGINA